MTKVNGMAVTFAMDLKFVAVEKPDGDSRQKAKELLDSYVGTDDNTAITDKSDYPNIIAVSYTHLSQTPRLTLSHCQFMATG